MQLLEIETLKQWQRVLPIPQSGPIRIPRLGLAIVFIDSRVDWSDEAFPALSQRQISQNTIGVRLSRKLDGILQISGVLQHLTAIDNICIVGKGEGEYFWLGNACLRAEMLPRYHKYLASWRRYGEHDRGDIPISICGDRDLVQNLGHSITQQLHQLTGCPVVALEWEMQHHSLGQESRPTE